MARETALAEEASLRVAASPPRLSPAETACRAALEVSPLGVLARAVVPEAVAPLVAACTSRLGDTAPPLTSLLAEKEVEALRQSVAQGLEEGSPREKADVCLVEGLAYARNESRGPEANPCLRCRPEESRGRLVHVRDMGLECGPRFRRHRYEAPVVAGMEPGTLLLT